MSHFIESLLHKKSSKNNKTLKSTKPEDKNVSIKNITSNHNTRHSKKSDTTKNNKKFIKKESRQNEVYILVVDDSDTILRKIKKVLSDCDYKVSFTHNGKKALSLIKEKKPDLVISDIHMPHMSGFELLKYIKSDIQFMDIPIILMTDDPYAHIVSSQKAGVNGVLKKPFKKKELIDQIIYILQE